MRRFLLILIALMTAMSMVAAKPRSAKNIRKEKQETTRRIKETSRKIDVNTRETSRQLNKLNSLNADIKEKAKSIRKMQHSIDSINRSIRKLNDSISTFDKHLKYLRGKYAEAVRKIDARKGSMNNLSFVFSAESFSQSYRRMRYLEQFSRWKARKTEEIKALIEEVEKRKTRLASMKDDRRQALSRMKVARQELQETKNVTSSIVDDLMKEGKLLKAYLKEKEKEEKALDEELERIIAEEQRKAEEARRAEEKRLAEERKKREEAIKKERLESEKRERKQREAEQADKKSKKKKDKKKKKKDDNKPEPEKEKPSEQKIVEETPKPDVVDNIVQQEREFSGSFESNKGRLLFPVSGKYKIVKAFGRQRHPDLKYVETNNSGIDIEVPAGSSARAVFDGTVSNVFRLRGFNNIVMVRHGSYLTIYANLGTISVKRGDAVKAGQTIGRIYSDADDDNRTILHFEIRKEKVKLDPEVWVK